MDYSVGSSTKAMKTDLKSLRKQAGLTQDEAAKLVSRSRDTWASYESGRTNSDGAVIRLFRLLVAPIIEARRKLGL